MSLDQSEDHKRNTTTNLHSAFPETKRIRLDNDANAIAVETTINGDNLNTKNNIYDGGKHQYAKFIEHRPNSLFSANRSAHLSLSKSITKVSLPPPTEERSKQNEYHPVLVSGEKESETVHDNGKENTDPVTIIPNQSDRVVIKDFNIGKQSITADEEPQSQVCTHTQIIEGQQNQKSSIEKVQQEKTVIGVVELSESEETETEEVEVTKSTLLNPSVTYPHARHFCGVHPFDKYYQTHSKSIHVVTQRKNQNEIYCSLCFCYICDAPATECTDWTSGEGHCNATDGNVTWENLRKKRRLERNNSNGIGREQDKEVVEVEEDFGEFEEGFDHRHNDSIAMENARDQVREKSKKDLRITDILSENLNKINLNNIEDNTSLGGAKAAYESTPNPSSSLSNKTTLSQNVIKNKMEGDIPQRVRIGWPYCKIMPPQRQMAFHLIKAFKSSKHVVIESPTGTGKSAAILCATLAWQRYHSKINNSSKLTKIVYCSRTHSQVAQMVDSLKKTPYRPKMAILGSRDRLCIHKDLKPRHDASSNNADAPNAKGFQLNNECRIRVGNTEKFRKSMFRSNTETYDDDNPPEILPGDDSSVIQRDINFDENNDMEEEEKDEDERGWKSKKFKTCPHYRQLSNRHLATKALSTFTPGNKQIGCCNSGGVKTKLGTHDIEDLVDFGVRPNVKRNVAIYRDPAAKTKSFGMRLKQDKTNVTIHSLDPAGAAACGESLNNGDVLLAINGESVKGKVLKEVSTKIKSCNDPLLIDVQRTNTTQPEKDGGYSPHSACPYYLSRALSKNADLVFAPYNYILDPKIRNALGIELEDSIVILDEAHNVEDTLREAGSGKFGEIEICELVVMLHNYSTMQKSEHTRVEGHTGTSSPDQSSNSCIYIPDVAHHLLLFVESIALYLKEAKNKFENNPGPKGARKVIEDYHQFNTPDNKEFEVEYHGPTGFGHGGKSIGCKLFFDRIKLVEADVDTLLVNIEILQKFSRSKTNDESGRTQNIMDRLSEIVEKFSCALNATQHYYISSIVSANGNLEYASEENEVNSARRNITSKRKPRNMPIIPPRTIQNLNRLPNPCSHLSCRSKRTADNLDRVRHGEYCDGLIPRWEASIVLNLLTPGMFMKELSSRCRSVVLASGSLAPIQSLCTELDLLPSSSETPTHTSIPKPSSDQTDIHNQYRLQTTPKPLEANHVINLDKQLLAVTVGHFPDGSPLSVKFKNINQPGFLFKLGDAISSIIQSIPIGGVLVFFSSYSLLNKCVKAWKPNEGRYSQFHSNMDTEDKDGIIWERLLTKGKVIVEPTGGQTEFDQAKDEYYNEINLNKTCILLAVFRGKMSEGISFNDNFARCVICVGIPFPSAFDQSIKAKKLYNDEQRKLQKRTKLLCGSQWYSQQAYRAISQALGRCIRHSADYGTIILLDSRHCDDGSPVGVDGCFAHKNLPKWMRHGIQNLHPGRYSNGRNDIVGGWHGLSQKIKQFFREAKPYCDLILKKEYEDLRKIQQQAQNSKDYSFNARTGKWSVVEELNSLEINHKVDTDSSTHLSMEMRCKIEKPIQLNHQLSDKSKTKADINSFEIIDVDANFSQQSISPTLKSASKMQSLNETASTFTQECHLCIVCEENEKNIVLTPCHHLCLCNQCFVANHFDTCPICRSQINSHIKVFN